MATLAVLAVALTVGRYDLAQDLTTGDHSRVLAYREVAAILRPALRPGGAVLATEIGTLGLELPGTRILDADFLVHRRPRGVARNRRVDWLAVTHQPDYFVVPWRLEAGERPVRTFSFGGRSVRYEFTRAVRVGRYQVAIFGRSR